MEYENLVPVIGVIMNITRGNDCWANKIKSVRMNAYNPVVADDIGTFSDKQVGDVDWLENFLVPNYDRTAFFKYVAR